MTYNELIHEVGLAKANSANFYGDFGFDADLIWSGDTLEAVRVLWPTQGDCTTEDAYRFAEALASFAFDLNRFVGAEISD